MEDDTERLKQRWEPAEPNPEAGQSADDPAVCSGEEPVTGPTAPPSE